MRRGPFSGGKVMHAHLCGRLPRNTLVAAYDPEVPACMISGDVAQWFRPLGALLDNVANGWTYNPIKWDNFTNQRAPSPSVGTDTKNAQCSCSSACIACNASVVHCPCITAVGRGVFETYASLTTDVMHWQCIVVAAKHDGMLAPTASRLCHNASQS